MRSLTIHQARRVALAAQGFNDALPTGRVDARHFRRVMARMAAVQLDSVNVCARSHYMPFFSRLGGYDRDALDRWLWRSRENFEYFAHAAALTPVDRYPLYGWRMQRERRRGQWLEQEQPDYVARVLDEIAERGPTSVTDLTDPGERTGPWWGYGKGKRTLGWLHATGQLAVSTRGRDFVTYYDLPERVFPPGVVDGPDIGERDAMRELLEHSANALGVATAADLADYHRLPVRVVRQLAEELAAAGALTRVEVEGWRDPTYMAEAAVVPRRMEARALLTPFDPVVWFRPRAERLFGFYYRIEIYVPKEQRQHGYYVMPFLLGDELVARVDLKADRQAGVLRVPGAFCEDGADPAGVAVELAGVVESMATWLGLGGISVGDRGDLVRPLAKALA